MSDYEPKIGDQVKWREGSQWSRRDVFGVVTRVGEASCTVRPLKGGKPKVWRRSKYGRAYHLNQVSEHEIAMDAWEARRPTLAVICARERGDRIDIEFRVAPDGAGMAAAIAEIETFTRWLAARPTGTP